MPRDPYRHEPFGELSGAQGKGICFTHHGLSDIVRAAGLLTAEVLLSAGRLSDTAGCIYGCSFAGSDLHERLIPYDPSANAGIVPESELYDDILANRRFRSWPIRSLLNVAMVQNFVRLSMRSSPPIVVHKAVSLRV